MKHLCTIVALVAALGSPAWGVETEENLPREAVARLGTLRYRHCNPILDLSLDPTGKMIATAGFLDDRVCLWDRISGRKLHELKVSFVKWVEFARDGSFLMVGTPEVEPKFRFFDTRTGRRLDKIDPTAVPPRALAETVQFNEPDVFLRDVNGKVLAKFNAPGEKLRFQFAAVASDGRTLAVSGRKGQSGCVWLWDIPSGKRLAVIETTGVGVVSNLRFSADGKVLAGLTTAVSTVQLWERTGKKLASVELDVQDAMFDFSPDATRLAVVGRTTDVSVLSLHNLPDGKELWRTDTDNAVSVVRFAEQGKMLYGGSWTGVIQTWDVASGAMTAPFGGHQGALNAVQLTSDNKFALTWSDDHSARWWNAGTGTELHRFPFPKQFQGSTVMLLDDHTVLAAGTVRDEDLEVTEGGVWIYDAESAQEKRKLTIPRLEVAMAQVSHDRRLLVLLDSVGCAHIHNLATGKELFVIQTGATREKKRLLRCGFSTDDRLLYLRECAPTGDSQVKPPLVRVIEMSTGKERRRFTLDDWAGGDEQVCLATPTGLVVDVWFGLLLLDPNTGLEVRRFSANSLRDSTASISSDGRYLAGGTRTGSIRFWDIATGTVLGELAGHRSAVTSLAFSEDGTRLISGSLDTTALIWDLREFLTRQPAPPRWNGAEQDRLWAELAHDDAAQADRAMQTLIRAGDKAVTLVRTRLGPAAFKADQASIDRLLEQLDSSDFKVRERADSELEELELAAEPALRRALASGSLSVETAQRVRRLLDGLDGRVRSPAQLRALRAIEVLEKIGTASAHNVLQILGKGSAEARQTQAARAAEQRLQKRNQSTPSP